MTKKGILLFFLLVLPIVAVFAQEPTSPASSPDRITSCPLWCRHIILVYINPSGRSSDFWTKEKFGWLIAYRDLKGQPKDFLFDGFLILGFSCKGGRHLLAVTRRKPSIKSDWEDAINNYLTGAQKLSEAFGDISRELNRTGTKAKVILAMPYPDPRQKSFGLIKGKNLDFHQCKSP
jgi:hypothetical protein